MQNVSCPSCGAPVAFRSHASVMAVCDFCKTTVLKEAGAVRDAGKMSDVLEDYSPIQIGTAGRFGGTGFTVIGRIQLRYSAGIWNEWYLMFDDGRAGWLGDSSGMFVMTTEKDAGHRQPGEHLPRFGELAVGRTMTIGGTPYIASEIRTARCVGGQGELPFRVGEGWEARVADFRGGTSFATLDYSDGESDSDAPALYVGKAVTLDELQCQLLRDVDTVLESAGKFRGKVSPLSCPSCGAGVSYVPGVTQHLVCPACQAQLDTSGPVAEVLAAGERVAAFKSTIAIGSKATIAGTAYEAIGVMRRADEEGTEWTEYLLYAPRAGFLWLVETDDGWSTARVQAEWPVSIGGDTIRIGPATFRKLYDYQARVLFAAGAFNWRVKAGDVVDVTEYESGQNKLAAERTAEELTLSLSAPAAADQVRAWFGLPSAPLPSVKAGGLPGLAKKFIVGILAVNAIPLLFAFGRTWLFVALAVAAIYFPARYLDSSGDKS